MQLNQWNLLYQERSTTHLNNKIVVSSTKYQEASIKFRAAWHEYITAEKSVKYEIVNMVTILERDEGMERMQAVKKVVDDHKDLPGFSKASIYRELPEDMKQTDTRRELKKLQEIDDVTNKRSDFSREKSAGINKTEQRTESEALKEFRETKGVKEQSASTTTIEEEPEGDIVEDQEVTYDSKFINNLIEVNQKYEELIMPFESRITATVKGQDIPFIVKIDPYKRVVTSLEVDEKEAKKLNK